MERSAMTGATITRRMMAGTASIPAVSNRRLYLDRHDLEDVCIYVLRL